MRDLKKKSFFKWPLHSLAGHVVLCQVVESVPVLIIFLGVNFYDGALTPDWALFTLFVASLTGLIAALLVWYTSTLPLIKRHEK